MYNYTVSKVHISQITAGDTVLHNGQLKTVCQNNISNDSFMGKAIFGDCYMSGHKKVEKVTFVKP